MSSWMFHCTTCEKRYSNHTGMMCPDCVDKARAEEKAKWISALRYHCDRYGAGDVYEDVMSIYNGWPESLPLDWKPDYEFRADGTAYTIDGTMPTPSQRERERWEKALMWFFVNQDLEKWGAAELFHFACEAYKDKRTPEGDGDGQD